MLIDFIDLTPQGEYIVALIGRAKNLTGMEAANLSSVWSDTWCDAWYDARDASWYAAQDAFRSSAWFSAQDVAQYATEYAAGDAAGGAAVALVVRDLISPDGFTQEHYDILTGPWRQIIGPIHPDDDESGDS